MDCSPPGSFAHSISQAGILKWAAISSSMRSPWPMDWICASYIDWWILYHWATWEAPFILYIISIVWASQVALMAKNLPTNAGDVRDSVLISGSRRSQGGGHGNPHQYHAPEEPVGLWSTGSERVGHDQSKLARMHHSVCVSPNLSIPPTPNFPLGIHTFVFCAVSVFLLCNWDHIYHFPRFHIYALTHNIYFFPPFLVYFTLYDSL